VEYGFDAEYKVVQQIGRRKMVIQPDIKREREETCKHLMGANLLLSSTSYRNWSAASSPVNTDNQAFS
jgi:hypothetical protein